jgi:predicted O-methyltransferase YrrM
MIFINAIFYYLKTYLTALPRIIYRSSLSIIFNFKGSQTFLNDVLDAQDSRLSDKIIRSVNLIEIIGDSDEDIIIKGNYYKKKTSDTRDLFELANIGYLVNNINPVTIFEIGTFVGRTTRLFALNTNKDCMIYTLDLPQNLVSHSIGSDYKILPESTKIFQLSGDSQSFDFSPYYGKADFVWVDACHDYEYVKKDTENALKICKQDGWIAWHDYRVTAWWSGVTKFVREFSKEYPQIMHIKGTTTAIMQKNIN